MQQRLKLEAGNAHNDTNNPQGFNMMQQCNNNIYKLTGELFGTIAAIIP